MNKPQGYNEAQAFTGEFDALPAGAYICQIKTAKLGKTSTDKEQLILLFDIIEGGHKDYFQKQFDNDSRAEKKWSGIYRQVTEGKSISFFKGMITSIEESNSGYKWNFDESTLKGKKIGAVFGREQWKNSSGELKWSTKCQAIRSTVAVNAGIEPPEDKYLNGNSAQNYSSTPSTNEFQEIPSDDDLPF